jgi:glycosyltransferase involved in cell wall biosynthesis
MKTVIAVHHFPPRHMAGAELRAYDAAAWLLRHGYDVDVVCVERVDSGPEGRVICEDDIYQGIPVHRLSFDMAGAPDPQRWEYDNPWIETYMQGFLAAQRPDVLHLISGYLMGAGTLRAATAQDIPIVISLTDFWFLCPRVNFLRPDGRLAACDQFDAAACTRCACEEKRRFRIPAAVAPGVADRFWDGALDRRLGKALGLPEIAARLEQRHVALMDMLSAADALICPSRFLLERFRVRGVDPTQLVLNTHGLDTSGWLPAPDAGTSDGKLRVGYLGQIHPHKGVHLLVEAFTRLPPGTPLELVIYGDATADREYARRLTKLARGDDRIKWMGRYQPSQVAQVLADIDVLVIPSTWNEIGPLVMYEALHTKTPVVASDIPNMSYVVEHGRNGLLFSCGSSADLATKLQQLLDDASLLPRLREGIEPVKSMDEEMAQIASLYQSVVRR